MQINRLANTVGQGVITNHIKYLESKEYTVLEVRLLMMTDADLYFRIPYMDNGSIAFAEAKNSIKNRIEEIHVSGGKVALFFDEYEDNKKRFPTIEALLEKGVDPFGLNKDDIVFFKSNEGIEIS